MVEESAGGYGRLGIILGPPKEQKSQKFSKQEIR